MKKIKLISIAAGLAASFLLATASNSASAEWAPKGPIKMMIGFKAGGGADTQARLIAEDLQARYGWQVIPEQVTGKGGLNLLNQLKKEPNDGTSIGMVVSESLTYNLLVARNTRMTPEDFTPIVSTASFQIGIVGSTDSGWKTMHDVIADAKAGKTIRFATFSSRLADFAYMLGNANGVRFNIISTKGAKAALNGVTAGDYDIAFAAGIQNNAVKVGDMVNLASAISEPLKISPEAPMFEDLNLKGFNADGFFLIVAPAGLPEDARKALSSAISEIVNDPSSKSNQYITKSFSGATTYKGEELEQKLASFQESSEKMLKAISE